MPYTFTTYIPGFKEAPISIKFETAEYSMDSTRLPDTSKIAMLFTSPGLEIFKLKLDVNGFGFNCTWNFGSSADAMPVIIREFAKLVTVHSWLLLLLFSPLA